MLPFYLVTTKRNPNSNNTHQLYSLPDVLFSQFFLFFVFFLSFLYCTGDGAFGGQLVVSVQTELRCSLLGLKNKKQAWTAIITGATKEQIVFSACALPFRYCCMSVPLHQTSRWVSSILLGLIYLNHCPRTKLSCCFSFILIFKLAWQK